MTTVFIICAALGAAILIIQLVMLLMGFGFDHDVGDGHAFDFGGGHDASFGDHHFELGGDYDAGAIGNHDIGGDTRLDAAHDHDVHEHGSSWFFSVLSVRSVVAALAFFGLAGLAMDAGGAQAKAALADAERVEAERRAELEAPAKAQKAKTIVEAEAEAEKRRIEAEGQAAAIFAKLEAEAKGQFEMLAKKGDGLQRIIDACGGAHEAFQLLMLEHLDTLAQTSAQAISNIKFDKVVVWENGGDGEGSNTSNFLRNLSHTLPPMLQVMKDVGGIEVPEYLAKLTPDGESGAAKDAKAPKTEVPEA